MTTEIFALLLVYQLKHFLADFPLQGKYMLGKFKSDWGFLGPLLAHVGVHGVFTLVICFVVSPALWWLSIVDMVVHFVMDRIKASPKYLGRFKALSGSEMIDATRYANWPPTNTRNLYQRGFSEEQVNKIRIEDAHITMGGRRALRHNTYFWWSLGLDQMVHHLTHYFIIWMLVS